MRVVPATVAIVLMLSGALLSACTQTSPNSATETSVPTATIHRLPPPFAGVPASPVHRYTNSTWGFRIDVPAGWTTHPGFTRSYLANSAWKTFAGPDSPGTAVVALVLPGSNHITDAEIRIGASKSQQAVRTCTATPTATRPGTSGKHDIGGIAFTTFAAGDAAMSHHLDVHSYRVVHDGACYAIDLLVFETNPQVYSPPATPPFTDAQAFTRMQKVVDSFRFTP